MAGLLPAGSWSTFVDVASPQPTRLESRSGACSHIVDMSCLACVSCSAVFLLTMQFRCDVGSDDRCCVDMCSVLSCVLRDEALVISDGLKRGITALKRGANRLYESQAAKTALSHVAHCPWFAQKQDIGRLPLYTTALRGTPSCTETGSGIYDLILSSCAYKPMRGFISFCRLSHPLCA
jgi:hypothetical protein